MAESKVKLRSGRKGKGRKRKPRKEDGDLSFDGRMPLFLFIFHSYIHSITFIQYIYPSQADALSTEPRRTI
jgi:hypothetical protein